MATQETWEDAPDGGVATSTGLNELRGFVSEREKPKESYRNNLVNVIDDVIPFNMSGKNCKSPLMLLVNP
jgi:hypothetical protein